VAAGDGRLIVEVAADTVDRKAVQQIFGDV
jgi:hypothetical protein